ncbi:MAG: emp24/gp25L/p24 family protein [Dehalococcoidia bacterium]|nr:MAG: emp24/gp25L/p24 family protein [Dehalococcoidia bacterium]
MRTFLLGLFVFALLTVGVVVGWAAMNTYHPGSVGTPAHAGGISDGHPELCTNVNFVAKARGSTTRTIPLDVGDLVRGTYEADGGFGRVDILARVLSPQGEELAVFPRASNYDFTFSAKERGDYAIVFDNRYSMYTAKSIGLYYCIDHAGPTSPSWQPGMPPP